MSSPAWLVCSLCGLKHSPRPDGRCPRCHGVLLTEAKAAVSVLRPPPVSLTLSENVPTGWRIAGAAFVANGILGVVSAFVVRNPFGDPRYAIAVSSVSALFALLLGAGLLRGRDGARTAAVALVVIALVACAIFAADARLHARRPPRGRAVRRLSPAPPGRAGRRPSRRRLSLSSPGRRWAPSRP